MQRLAGGAVHPGAADHHHRRLLHRDALCRVPAHRVHAALVCAVDAPGGLPRLLHHQPRARIFVQRRRDGAGRGRDHRAASPRFHGQRLFRAFLMSPLVLPTIVTGGALLQFYYLIDMDAPMTGLLIGHMLITIPYVCRTVGAGLVGLDPAIEEAAGSLGAGGLRTLLKVTLPAIAPSIMAAMIFVFITSFDQATVSIFLAGPDMMPLPVRIYAYIDFAVDPMVAAVSTLLIIFAFGVIALLQKMLGLDRAMGVN